MKKEITVPYSTLEKEVCKNSFSLLRMFCKVFGVKNARDILNMLSNKEADLKEVNSKIYSYLKESYTSFSNLSDSEVEKELISLYEKANVIILKLIDTSFKGMENDVGLLPSISVPLTNLAERFKYILSPDKVEELCKFEFVRQDIIALILLELNEHNHLADHIHKLHNLNTLFETNIYEGKVGLIHNQKVFSVHDNRSNQCMETFYTLGEAKTYIKTSKSSNLHLKKQNWKVRNVKGIGPVLRDMRTKSDFSIINKAIANGENRVIKINTDLNLRDSMGFMFVTPNTQGQNMLNKILYQIRNEYPDIKIEPRNFTLKDRGQSGSVELLRIILRSPSLSRPIEIMVLEQNWYLNYRYDIEQAHLLYRLRKSKKAASLLFPNEVYNHDNDKIEYLRKKRVKDITKQLLEANRVEIN